MGLALGRDPGNPILGRVYCSLGCILICVYGTPHPGGSLIFPGHLLHEVFQACPIGRRPQVRSRTCWRDYISQWIGRARSGILSLRCPRDLAQISRRKWTGGWIKLQSTQESSIWLPTLNHLGLSSWLLKWAAASHIHFTLTNASLPSMAWAEVRHLVTCSLAVWKERWVRPFPSALGSTWGNKVAQSDKMIS